MYGCESRQVLKVLITCRQMQHYIRETELPDWLSDVTLVLPPLSKQGMTTPEILEFAHDCEIVVVGDDEIGRSFFSHTPRLRALIKWGVGYDSIDTKACEDASVIFRNTPGVFGDDVAEMAILLMLSLERSLIEVHESITAGGWLKPVGRSVAGLSLGIYGFGSIGRSLHSRAKSFGMETAVFDPYFSTAKSDHDFKRVESLRDLASLSVVLVVCCPLTDETRGSIDSGVFGIAKSGMTLVNVSRGPVINETDLIQALSEGTVAGAGLDVFEDEPLPFDSGLRSMKNVVFSSHNSSNTRQAIAKASKEVLRIMEPIIQSS